MVLVVWRVVQHPKTGQSSPIANHAAAFPRPESGSVLTMVVQQLRLTVARGLEQIRTNTKVIEELSFEPSEENGIKIRYLGAAIKREVTRLKVKIWQGRDDYGI